jgi:hypothetical protein
MNMTVRFEKKTFVLCVGAQKAGTSWLYSYLSERGDIYIPHKELHYFDMKYAKELPGRRSVANGKYKKRGQLPWNARSFRDPSAYVEYFREGVPANIRYFGELTPAYALIGEEGFREIRGLFENIRVVYIMRDPVERLYSQMRMVSGKFAQRDKVFELDSLVEKKGNIERSMYETTIANLEKVFAPGDIVYLFYETLFREETIMRLCAFLGVPYLPAKFDEVVRGSGDGVSVPAELDARLRQRLAPTYAFCREKFGDAIPEKWHV